MKDKLLNIRVNEQLMEQLNQVSSLLDIPYSQFVRQAIAEKISRMEPEFPELAGKTESAPLKVAA